jgi:predicted HTH transcriptional regulator
VLEAVVLKTLAGFMNGDGGTLLIGVADDGRILGLANDYQSLKKQDRDGFAQAIMTAVASKLGTELCQLTQILFHSMEGKDICRVITAPSLRPVFLKQDVQTKFYLRTGNGTRELNIQEAMEFTAHRWP